MPMAIISITTSPTSCLVQLHSLWPAVLEEKQFSDNLYAGHELLSRPDRTIRLFLWICMVTRKARIFHSGAKQGGLASSEGRTGIHTPENSYVWLGVSAHPWEVVFSTFTYVFAS